MATTDVRDPAEIGAADVRIIRALQIAPRASYALLGRALGVTEQAVARRYRHLVDAGLVRVVGVTDPGAFGETEWLLRLRCRPGSAHAIARSLAGRPDVTWVAVVAAGAEVTCALRSRDRGARDDLLTRRLPGTAAVIAIDACLMLRQFIGGRAHYWKALSGVLDPDQEAALGAPRAPFVEHPAVGTTPIRLLDGDEALLAALAADGRAAVSSLAAASGLTGGRTQRRLDALFEQRVVHLDVEIMADALGLRTRANLWIRAHPARVVEIGRALAGRPEIAFAAAVSGTHNLHAVAHARDVDELFTFTSGWLAGLDGLQQLEISPIREHVKQAGTLVLDGRLA